MKDRGREADGILAGQLLFLLLIAIGIVPVLVGLLVLFALSLGQHRLVAR